MSLDYRILNFVFRGLRQLNAVLNCHQSNCKLLPFFSREKSAAEKLQEARNTRILEADTFREIGKPFGGLEAWRAGVFCAGVALSFYGDMLSSVRYD